MKLTDNVILFTSLFALIAICSCSGNQPLQARYQAEKMFHEAENALTKAQAFSSKISEHDQAYIANEFNSLVEFCYTQLSQIDSAKSPVEFNEFNYITYQATTRLSQIYYLNKEYDKCALITKRLLTDVNIPTSQRAAVYINLGQSLQSGGNWDSSYVVYENALDIFSPPLTNTNEIIGAVFNLPLYIFRVVHFINESNKITYELTKTENYYLNLIQDFKGHKLEIASRSNLAKLYEETGQWEKELAQLKFLTDPNSKSYVTVLLKTADLLGGKLKQHDTATALYNTIFAQTTEDDKTMRAVLLFKKSLIQIDMGNYDDARTLLHQIAKDYSREYDQSPLFQYNLARSFELQNKWNRAEQEYNLLLEKFKGSSESMMTLLYLVDYFRKENKTTDLKRWFARAESYFADLAQSGKGNLLEARALLYSADLYNRNDEFEKSAEILTSIYNKYPDTDPGKQALLKAIRLYNNKLDNPQKADSLLEQLKITLVQTVVSTKTEDLLEI